VEATLLKADGTDSVLTNLSILIITGFIKPFLISGPIAHKISFAS
jgi:hypothetical protein